MLPLGGAWLPMYSRARTQVGYADQEVRSSKAEGKWSVCSEMDHVHGIQGKKLVSRDLPSVNKGLGADNGDNDNDSTLWSSTRYIPTSAFSSRQQNAKMMFPHGLVDEFELITMDSA